MLWYAHMLIAAAAVSFYTLNPYLILLGALVAVVPDLDHPFGHRGWFSHSILAISVMSVIIYFFARDVALLITVFIALGSHLLADLITKSGIPLLYPAVKKSISIPLFPSTGRKTNKLAALIGLCILSLNLLASFGYFINY